MYLQPSPNQDVLERFDNSIGRYFRWANRKCVELSRQTDEISVTEMYVQEKSLVFLDLALPSRRTTPWKTYCKKLSRDRFPLLTKEYFLAENIRHGHGLSGLYTFVKRYNLRRWRDYENTLRRYFFSLIPEFEQMILTPLWTVGRDEKTQILYKYLRAYKHFDLDLFDERFPFLIHHCTNPPLESELTVHMLRTLCDTDDKKLSAMSAMWDEKTLKVMLCHAGEMRFDFWGMWSGSGLLAHQFDFVAAFLALGAHLRYAIILIKFGFPYITDDEAFRLRCYNLQKITYDEEDPIVCSVRPLIEKARDGQKTRMMLIIDTFAIFCDFPEGNVFKDSVQTLVCLTRSLPDPYVTPSELYSTMQPMIKPEFMPSLEAVVNEYAEAGIFDDEYDTYSPRKLMHLCRVAIRQRLASNFKLLDGIEDLVIPTTLKRYLKLENSITKST